MTTFAADDFDAIREGMRELGLSSALCSTCEDLGWVDESLGAPAGTHMGWCPCPDCHNPKGYTSP